MSYLEAAKAFNSPLLANTFANLETCEHVLFLFGVQLAAGVTMRQLFN